MAHITLRIIYKLCYLFSIGEQMLSSLLLNYSYNKKGWWRLSVQLVSLIIMPLRHLYMYVCYIRRFVWDITCQGLYQLSGLIQSGSKLICQFLGIA
jgi:hypothetical protein